MSAQAIAKRERCSLRHINMTPSLAFLSPLLVKAAVEVRLPRGIDLEQLRELPLEWDRRFDTLGHIGESWLEPLIAFERLIIAGGFQGPVV
jgi:hypothetical protein